MPLTEAQKIEVRTILEVRQNQAWSGGFGGPYQVLESRLGALTADQITKVEELLTQWETVKFSTGKLTGEFQDDPARKRAHIKSMLVTVIDFDPRDYMGGGLSVGRG